MSIVANNQRNPRNRKNPQSTFTLGNAAGMGKMFIMYVCMYLVSIFFRWNLENTPQLPKVERQQGGGGCLIFCIRMPGEEELSCCWTNQPHLWCTIVRHGHIVIDFN